MPNLVNLIYISATGCLLPAQSFRMAVTCGDILKLFFAFFLPPVAVAMEKGCCNCTLLLNIILTLLGFIPGIEIFQISDEPNTFRSNTCFLGNSALLRGPPPLKS